MPAIFPLKPIVFPFKRSVSSLFVVHRPYTIGADADGKIMFLSLRGDKPVEQIFPPRVHEGGLVKALAQANPRFLFLIQRRFIYLLDIDKKTQLCEAPSKLELLNFEYEDGMVCDLERRLVMALYRYNESEQSLTSSYELRLESLVSGVTQKKIPIEYHNPGGVGVIHAFGGTHFFCRASVNKPWTACDDNLSAVTHPFANLLNAEASSLGELSHIRVNGNAGIAAIISSAGSSSVCFLVTWKGAEPAELTAVTLKDSNGRQPFDWPSASRFSLSPSGRWMLVPVRDERGGEGSYLVRIDSDKKTKYLPPFDLGFNGAAEQVAWMAEPEGLVVLIENRLLYWDLSGFGEPQ